MSAYTTNYSDSSPYHPDFASPEADFLLASTDGSFFRVHSFTLKTTTKFFREYFQERKMGPVPQRTSPDGEIPFDTGYPARILIPYLQMISGLPVSLFPPRPTSPSNSSSYTTSTCLASIAQHYTHITALITLVSPLPEGWEAPGPMEQIRSSLNSPWALSDPLRLYSVACKFGWEQEMKVGARGCCTVPIWSILREEDQINANPGDHHDNGHHQTHNAGTQTGNTATHDSGGNENGEDSSQDDEDRPSKPPTSKELLLSLTTPQLARLFLLQRARRDAFKRALETHPYFINAGMNDRARRCTSCNEIDSKGGGNWEWRELKNLMLMEIDRRAEGDTIVGRVGPQTYSVIGLGLGLGAESVANGVNQTHGRVSIEEWQEGKMCFEAKCSKEGCGKLKYDRVQVMRIIRECLQGLPGDL